MMQYLRSLVFFVFMYGLMLVMGLICMPLALWSREGAWWVLRRYTDIVLWALRRICGLGTEIRGEVPTGDVIVASKHQSFLDILMIVNALPRPKFVMKKSLRWMPVLGFYAMRIGCAPIDRAGRGRTVKRLVADMARDEADAGQLVIYPQGTRVAPGATLPYKAGAGALYEAQGLPCVPASTNAGMFWPRLGILRKPGLAVVEFHPPIPPGLGRKALTARLRDEIEARSDALMAEARARG